MTPSPHKILPEIQGLRALAVLSVMAFHLNATFLPGGFVGVDIFFVISGYVVTKSLLKLDRKNIGQFLKIFYAKRLARIIPALMFCILVTSLFVVLFIPRSWLSESIGKVGFYALFGLSNIALVLTNDGYFAPRTEFNPFTHTWSLAVEEQFYVIYPIFLFVSFWLASIFKDNKRIVLGLALSLLAASLAFAAYATKATPDQAFYWLPSRYWELGAGAALAIAHAQDLLKPNAVRISKINLAAGLILIIVSLALTDPTQFPFPWALVPVIGTALLINGVQHANTSQHALGKSLALPPFTWIGDLSYSLYLWHWPVYILMRWTVGLDTVPLYLIAFVATFACASFSYYFVENSYRHSTFTANPQKPMRTILLALSLVLVSTITGLLLFENRHTISLSTTKDYYAWHPEAHEPKSLPADVQNLDFTGRTLYMLGDSHTGAYSTLLHELTIATGLKTEKMQLAGCTMLKLKWEDAEEGYCKTYRDSLITQIENTSKPGDVVMFASNRALRLGDQWYRKDQDGVFAEAVSEVYADKIKRNSEQAVGFITRLQNAGLTVLIDRPKPNFPAPAFRCSDWFNQISSFCQNGLQMERAQLVTLHQAMNKQLDAIAARHPNVKLWDPFPLLCPEEMCKANLNGTQLYFDGDHITADGNRLLLPHFAQYLNQLWAKT